MGRERSRSACIRRLESLAGSTLDVDALSLEAVAELRRAIGFDFWGVPLVDPDTLIPSRAVVSDPQPWGPHLPRRWVWDQGLDDVNSRAELARGPRHVGVLSAATGGDLNRCRRWRELGEPMGMGDELRAAIVDERGCWGSFELFRSGGDRPFGADDALLVRDAGRILAPALRRGGSGLPGNAPERADQTGLVLLDGDLRPKGLTEAARVWFGLLGSGAERERTPMPIHVYGVVGRLLAAEAGEDADRRPRVRVRTVGGHWAVVEAARVEGEENTVAVTMRRATRGDVLALVARANALTARERELVELVVAGLDTRELAKRMFISAYTVKDHLKSVFHKLRVHSRRELVTRVFGQAP